MHTVRSWKLNRTGKKGKGGKREVLGSACPLQESWAGRRNRTFRLGFWFRERGVLRKAAAVLTPEPQV